MALFQHQHLYCSVDPERMDLVYCHHKKKLKIYCSESKKLKMAKAVAYHFCPQELGWIWPSFLDPQPSWISFNLLFSRGEHPEEMGLPFCNRRISCIDAVSHQSQNDFWSTQEFLRCQFQEKIIVFKFCGKPWNQMNSSFWMMQYQHVKKPALAWNIFPQFFPNVRIRTLSILYDIIWYPITTNHLKASPVQTTNPGGNTTDMMDLIPSPVSFLSPGSCLNCRWTGKGKALPEDFQVLCWQK